MLPTIHTLQNQNKACLLTYIAHITMLHQKWEKNEKDFSKVKPENYC